jgi:hypothetical protein
MKETPEESQSLPPPKIVLTLEQLAEHFLSDEWTADVKRAFLSQFAATHLNLGFFKPLPS